jgi:hypothetical protein
VILSNEVGSPVRGAVLELQPFQAVVLELMGD